VPGAERLEVAVDAGFNPAVGAVGSSIRTGGFRRWFAVAVVAAACVLALAPGLFAPMDPEAATAHVLEPPSAAHLLGTDENGFDILSRLIWGARVDMLIAVVSTAVGLILGTLLGAWAGYQDGRARMGWASEAFQRALDVIQAFPIFVLALALVAILGRNIYNLIYVLIVLEVPIFARLTRSAVLVTREAPFVDAARCAGNSEMRLLLRHILPNSLTPSLTNGSVMAGMAVLLTAGLSFVGAGVPAPTAEWGYMVSTGAKNLFTGEWWPALFPGVVIGLVVFAFAVLGDELRYALDPTNERKSKK
jgi:peptide/nickel transport system permease protein